MTAGHEDHLATLRAFYDKRTEGLCLAERRIDGTLWLCLLPAGHEGGCK